MRRRARLLAGILLGGGALLAYVQFVGVGEVLSRVQTIPRAVVAAVAVLVVLEGVVDGLGVWASVHPLGDGLDGRQSVTFALAGDFFDIVSPAGAASSEPIMAQFISTTTGTGYSEALGVRGVAKYVKAAGQVALSGGLGLLLLHGSASAPAVQRTLGAAVVVLLLLGIGIAVGGDHLARGLVRALTALARVLDRLVPRLETVDTDIDGAVERFRRRIGAFRNAPGLVALITLGGVLEQVIVAVALWFLLGGPGAAVSLLTIVVVVPLPQAATVVPLPASLGAYDLLLGGALVLTTGVAASTAATAVLVFRGLTLTFGLSVGGVCAAMLRGWRVWQTE